MKPVVLVKLPNSTQFLGTFDTGSYQKWWKSEPLPGSIDTVIQTVWCYAQYHLCVVKGTDGSYYIYRSVDYGKTWEPRPEVWREIYCLVRIDYGWMLMNTSEGWFSSTNTGLTWTLVSTDAPNCTVVVNMEENVLLAANSSYIYRSPDVGYTWQIVQDCKSMKVKDFHDQRYVTNILYNGPVYPSLAGHNGRVLAGVGPYLLLSDDSGLTWMGHPSYIYPGYGWNKNKQVVRWGEGSCNWNPSQQQQFLQLVHTKIATTPDDDYYMARVYHPVQGIVRNYLTTVGGMGWNALFDQQYAGLTAGSIEAYETLVVGTGDTQILVFNSQMAFNPTSGMSNPSPKFSVDGGVTWTDLDVNQFRIYHGDPDQEGDYTLGGPFTEEAGTHFTWIGPPCHNGGKYVPSGYYVRGISHDMDLNIKYTPTYSLPFSIDVSLVDYQTLVQDYAMDFKTYLTYTEPAGFDTLLARRPIAPQLVYTTIKDITDLSYAVKCGLAATTRNTIQFGSMTQAKKSVEGQFDLLGKGEIERTCSMSVVLVTGHDWSARFEKYMPQYPYMDFPQLDYDVLNTRKNPVL
jgi:hypothetical protein